MQYSHNTMISIWNQYKISFQNPRCIFLLEQALIAISHISSAREPHMVSSYHHRQWSEVKSLSRVQLFATPWTIAYQVPRSMGFSRQEYWNGLPFPSPGDLPNQGSNPDLPHCRQTLNHLNHQGSHHGQFSSVQPLSRVRLFATPWTVACQVPRSMGFSRQEYWSGVPLPSPLTVQETLNSLLQHHSLKASILWL